MGFSTGMRTVVIVAIQVGTDTVVVPPATHIIMRSAVARRVFIIVAIFG